MKILHVSAAAELGGVEAVLLNILKSLDRSRFTPYVLLLQDGPFVRELERTGTETHVIEAGRIRNVLRGCKAIAKTVRLIRSKGIDLVHSHNAKAHVYGGLAAAMTGVPSLYHLHGVPRFTFSRDGFVSLISVAVHAGRTVACSAYVAEAFSRAWHSKRAVLVVHNGTMPPIPAEHYAIGVREELGIPQEAPLVVAATRLQRGKGVHILVLAASKVIEHYPEAHFIIVGGALLGLDNEYPLELQKQVEDLKLTHAVRFVGFQSDVIRYYSEADVVAHPAVEPEAFGMVLLEAMACGKPLVATDIGGPREIVERGVTGLLVPPNDADQLGRAILALLADPQRRSRMGQAGSARVRDRFSAQRMVAQLEAVYNDLVQRPGGDRLGEGKHTFHNA